MWLHYNSETKLTSLLNSMRTATTEVLLAGMVTGSERETWNVLTAWTTASLDLADESDKSS